MADRRDQQPVPRGHLRPGARGGHRLRPRRSSATLPAELDGRYLRNGPNPIADRPTRPRYHWFIGDGMVHGVRLRDGKAEWYRNRWVRGPPRSPPALGEPEPEPASSTAAWTPANTNVIGHAGRTFAIVEAGARPVELTDELDTVCGAATSTARCPTATPPTPSATPRPASCTRPAYYWGRPERAVHRDRAPTAGCASVEADRRRRRADGARHVAHREPWRLLRPAGHLRPRDGRRRRRASPTCWNDGHPPRVGVLPREGTAADVRWFDVEPCYVFHPLNAYDDGDTRRARRGPPPDACSRTDRTGPNEGAAHAVALDGRPDRGHVANEEQLDDRASRVPAGRRAAGRPAAPLRLGRRPPSTADDLELRRQPRSSATTCTPAPRDTHDFGAGRSAGEAVFVPAGAPTRRGRRLADVTLVHDAATDRSELVVLGRRRPRPRSPWPASTSRPACPSASTATGCRPAPRPARCSPGAWHHVNSQAAVSASVLGSRRHAQPGP